MCDPPLDQTQIAQLEAGIDMNGYLTKPAHINAQSPSQGEITITEGKYHQIKRMFHAVGSEITFLKRESFGPLVLDPQLEQGKWRFLTDAEITALTALQNK